MNLSEKWILIDGMKTFYREKGEGGVLLLIHGMGGSLVFDKVIEPLSGRFKVIVVDLPGFGLSDKPLIEYSVDFYVKFLAQFCKKTGIDAFNIAGLSLGGMIAALFASKNPEKVKNLFIISAAGLKPVAKQLKNPAAFWMFSIIMRLFIFSNSWALKMFQRGSYFNPKNIDEKVFRDFYQYMKMPGAKRAWLSAIKNVIEINDVVIRRFSEIKTDTVIIWGKEDKTFPVEYAYKFNKLVADSKIIIINNCGHTLTIEKPNEFVEILKRY